MTRILAAGRRFPAGAVIFDKDCTLIDSPRSWPELVELRARILVERYGVPPDLGPVLCRAIGYDPDTRQVASPSPLATGPRLQAQVAMATVLFLHGRRWDEALASAIAAFDLADAQLGLGAFSTPYPGAMELVQALAEAGVPMAVASNDSGDRTRSILAHAGMAPFIRVVVGGDEVGAVKPAPDLALAACERLGAAPADAVVIGDSLADIEMGEAAGVGVTIGVMTGMSSRSELALAADVVVDSVADITVVGE